MWNENEIDKNLLQGYNSFIYSLYGEDNQSVELIFTDEAKKHLIYWQNAKRKEYFYSDLEVHTSIQAKYEVYALRFAVILQMIYAYFNGREKYVIDLFIVHCAIKITEYYFNNAIRVHSIIHKINPIEKLTVKQKKLYKSLEDVFKTKDFVKKSLELDIPERTTKDFLKNKIDILFVKLDHGKYKKLY